jgi:lysozyme family protein
MSSKTPDLFDKVMDYVLKNEGGYVWNPNDPGGPTNFGITQAQLSQWRGVPVSPVDVEGLTIEEAKKIYYVHFWCPIGVTTKTPLAIATCILDTSILYGPHFGVLFAQNSLNTLGANIAADGQLGPVTNIALLTVDVKTFVETYVANILIRIDSVIAARPKSETFRGGWTARAKRLLTLV